MSSPKDQPENFGKKAFDALKDKSLLLPGQASDASQKTAKPDEAESGAGKSDNAKKKKP